jgi:NAD(P)H-dependent FMN reductase
MIRRDQVLGAQRGEHRQLPLRLAAHHNLPGVQDHQESIEHTRGDASTYPELFSTLLADIPAFNADREDERIAVIEDWRRRVDTAAVVLVAAPEYAGGVAGAVKNAFDWLVGSGNMYRKPVGVISAGTSGGQHARRMTTQTLTWQGAYVVAELGITAPRTKSDDEGRFTDAPTLAAISSLTELLLAAAAMPATDLVDVARRLVGSLGIDAAYVTPGV